MQFYFDAGKDFHRKRRKGFFCTITFTNVIVCNSYAAGPICTEVFSNKDSKDHEKLIDLYGKCIAEGLGCDLQYSIAYANRGRQYYRISKYEEALNDLDKAVN
ncbi:MAG: hypothetical protein VR65_07010 [Desulfobulbaceae bacterium BRH_c16a]|nr:MAG: hypothetical protein VR65_07010 [Desulfobulbaceae bacterium BRH_c16a]